MDRPWKPKSLPLTNSLIQWRCPCDWLIKATWKSRKWCQSFLSKALRIRKKRIDEINMKKTTGKEVIRTPLVSHPNTVMWLGLCFGKTKTMPYYSRKILNGKFYFVQKCRACFDCPNSCLTNKLIYQRHNPFALSSENPLKVQNSMTSFLSQSSSDYTRQNINKENKVVSTVQ